MTEFEEGGVAGGSCRFCGSLKSASEMNLSYEVEVSQLTSGGTKALRPSSLVLSSRIFRIVLARGNILPFLRDNYPGKVSPENFGGKSFLLPKEG